MVAFSDWAEKNCEFRTKSTPYQHVIYDVVWFDCADFTYTLFHLKIWMKKKNDVSLNMMYLIEYFHCIATKNLNAIVSTNIGWAFCHIQTSKGFVYIDHLSIEPGLFWLHLLQRKRKNTNWPMWLCACGSFNFQADDFVGMYI